MSGNGKSRSWVRRTAGWLPALAVAMGLGLSASPAQAQEEDPNAAPAGEGSSGKPIYGYAGAGVLACGILFVTCKSARR